MKEILVIGDSLAAHRPDGILESERWPNLLNSRTNCKIENIAKTYSTTKRLNKDVLIKDMSKYDHIIIQLGIVDCAPRRLYKWETSLIYRLPFEWRTSVLKYLKKNREQKKKMAYVSSVQFEKKLRNFLTKVECNVLFILILPATKRFLQVNPLVGEQIDHYNSIIKDICSEFSTVECVGLEKEEVECLTLEDGYHLNKNGHNTISNIIYKVINGIN